jgi:uncharacterized membrane protein
MSKFVVAVFPTEAKAYEGTRVMKDLQAEGSLALYGMAVVAKAADGKLGVKETSDEGPLSTGVGALTGGLIGLIGGPAGAAAGLAGGALIGSWSDLFNLGVGRDFLDKVSRELTPGKSAVVAEVEEDWVTPLDTRMEAIGGAVLRQGRADFEHEQILEEVNADKAELAELQAEYRQAREEHKAKLKARIDETRAKFQSAAERAKAKRERLQEETDAKVKALQEQRATAKTDDKAKYEQRIAKLRADYDRVNDKLIRAADLWVDAESLAP